MEDKLKLLEDLKKRLVEVINEYKTTFGKNKPNNATAKPAENKPADATVKPAENKPADATVKPAENKPAETTKPTENKPASGSISGSVGQGGTNNPEDAKTVQNLLNKNGASPALVVDGIVGPKTIAAISQFQSAKLSFSDGLIEPNKNTWKALNGASETKAAENKPANPNNPAANILNQTVSGTLPATEKPADNKTVVPSSSLSGSVGEGGANKPEDVALVKTLINKFMKSFDLNDKANLGLVGKTTITEIKKFQQTKVGLANPDGRIDVGGQSWKVLSGEVKPSTTSTGNGKFADTLPNGKLIYEDLATQKHGAAFVTEIKAMAQRLKINPNFIMATMKMESEFDHTIRNGEGSGATGLIQFMPETAADLGTTTDALAAMSAIAQLKYVEKYYEGTPISKVKEPAESYLLVFYPYAIGQPDSYVLGSQDGTVAAIARQNGVYDLNGDGQVTKGEVLEYQRKHKFKDVYEQLQQAPASDTPQPPANGENKPADNSQPVTASKTLSASVGEGGTNKPEDVALVKTLINKFIRAFNLSDTANLGKMGKYTIDKIKEFQQQKVGIENPDGRIDVGGKSWKVLNGETPAASTNDGAPTGNYYSHPNAANVGAIRYGNGETARKMIPEAEKLLQSILAKAGLSASEAQVNSTKRSYYDQARIIREDVRDADIWGWYGLDPSIVKGFSSHEECAKWFQTNAPNISNHIPGYALDVQNTSSAFHNALDELIPIKGSGVRTYLREDHIGITHVEFTFEVTSMKGRVLKF